MCVFVDCAEPEVEDGAPGVDGSTEPTTSQKVQCLRVSVYLSVCFACVFGGHVLLAFADQSWCCFVG